MIKRQLPVRGTISLILLGILIVFLLIQKNQYGNIPIEKIEDFTVHEDILAYFLDKEIPREEGIKNLASYCAVHDYIVPDFEVKEIESFQPRSKNYFIPYAKIYGLFNKILKDIQVFPIGEEYIVNSGQEYVYPNSWKAERNYGGARPHLGIDIMDMEDQPGRIPILSMTDGVIQNMGWNEKGGWRVGIRSPENTYFYYAHLDHYAQGLEEGMKIEAGQCIGYMGNTGYGKEPGTSGKFATHLHVGILIDEYNEEELWINPYYILRYLEKNQKEKLPGYSIEG